MALIITAVAAGVLGTLTMDVLNYLASRTGLILKIDVRMIGRLTAGWTRGRFRYSSPDQVESRPIDLPLGVSAHYATGIVLAFVYVLAWDLLIGGAASPAWAVVYGFATTVISEFVVYPSMGLGACGRRSPQRIKAALSPVANHLFFGVGMAIAIAAL